MDMGDRSRINGIENLTVLVTGANSGLGFEASAQLAEAGYLEIILACRTIGKAENARKKLVNRLGIDSFETLEVDVSSIKSANSATDQLIARGDTIDHLLLNAGIVAGDEMQMSEDGIELAFASSLIGHHIIANRLLEAGLVGNKGRIVIAGSEAARNDLPGSMGMELYDFATTNPVEFGNNLHDAMMAFARGSGSVKFNGFRHYAGTKLFSTWWAAEMATKYGDNVSVYAVSPGSTLLTNVSRNIKGLKKFMFTKVMPKIPFIGMHQPIDIAAKRYVDVLTAPNGQYINGRSYMSKPTKLIGPMVEQTYPHMLDVKRQEAAWAVVGELAGTAETVADVRSA
jgi:NAD(P)-dependent dehydrogenase (short-subunit alcohol dehydrogenase family)